MKDSVDNSGALEYIAAERNVVEPIAAMRSRIREFAVLELNMGSGNGADLTIRSAELRRGVYREFTPHDRAVPLTLAPRT
jgi:hypothetical protein